ncbi:MAG TPA: hypothetical protein VJR29_02105 [bacterium]|nr:hypothetical protein [bacterium]
MIRDIKRWAASFALVGSLMALTSVVDATQVALFDNDSYVDTDEAADDCGAEANNLLVSINSFGGHTVTPFTGITDADFTAALAGQQVLIIPELETGDLEPDLSTEAIAVIHDFVEQGGRLLVFGEAVTPLENLLNTIFGFSLDIEGSPDTSNKTAEAAGTIFADGPATIPYNDGTAYILDSTLPAEAISIYNYNDGIDDFSVVTIFPFGSGDIIFFGWDWYGSTPPGGPGDDCEGGQDGGWQGLLSTALQTAAVPTPSPTPTPEPDGDGDGVPDADDNCPIDANADQDDSDQDGIGDECDSTPAGFELGGGGCSLQVRR